MKTPAILSVMVAGSKRSMVRPTRLPFLLPTGMLIWLGEGDDEWLFVVSHCSWSEADGCLHICCNEIPVATGETVESVENELISYGFTASE